MTPPSPLSPSEAERRAGFIAAAGAYFIWGLLPLYLKLMQDVDAREVLAQRVLWCVPAAFVAIFVMSGWKSGWSGLGQALRPRMLGVLAVSASVIFVNWGLYVWLVLEARVMEASLAYFLSPILSVAIGVLFFQESVTRPQIIALALAALGVIAQGFALGNPPWMALALCATWLAYAVIRKRAPVPAATGLFVESLVLAPLACVLLAWTMQSGALSFGSDWRHTLLLALAGVVTAAPLMAFTFGARRVSFTALGLLQFTAPTLQFLTGLMAGEPFTPMRALSFGLIWAGLAFFAWDTLARARKI